MWTEERDAALTELWGQRIPTSEIAKQVGAVSKNAVIGRAHRIGLPSRRLGHKAMSAIARANNASRQSKRTVHAPPPKLPEERKPMTRAAVVESLHKAPEALPDPATDLPPLVAFSDLDDHHCRWIPGEPLGGCCGRQKVPGLPYCEVHSRRAYEPRPISKRPTNYTPKIPGAVYAKIKRDHRFLQAVSEFFEP